MENNKVNRAWKIVAIILIIVCLLLLWQVSVYYNYSEELRVYGKAACELSNRQSEFINKYMPELETPLELMNCDI